jgi:hypothetical protein
VLIGSVHDQDRYRRDPNEIYGADSYVERPQLPDALGPVLQGFGEAAQAPEPPSVPPEPSSVPPEPPPVAPEPPPAAPAVSPPPQPAPQVAQADGNVGEDPLAQAGGNAGEDPLAQAGGNAGEDPLAEAVAEAERLARVIVSDVILYNPEMFDAAVTAGNVVEALASELVEGRAHFAQRADPRVRDTKDFLAEALLHAARERSGA